MLAHQMNPKIKRRIRRRRPAHLDRYWTTSDLEERYGRKVRTLVDWQRTRGFPKPLIRGGHGAEHRWLVEDVIAWEESLRDDADEESRSEESAENSE